METPWKFHSKCRGECKSSHAKSETHWMIMTLQHNVASFMIYLKNKTIMQHFNPEFLYNHGKNSRDSNRKQSHHHLGTLFFQSSSVLASEIQQGEVPSPALWSQQPHATLQAWGGVAGKLPSGEGPWGAGRQPAEHEPVVCPGGQAGQQHPGLHQE